MEALTKSDGVDALVGPAPAPWPTRRRAFVATLIAAAALALAGGGYASAQIPGGSGSPGAGFLSHCH